MLRHRILLGILVLFHIMIAVNRALANDLPMTIWWGIGAIIQVILLSIVVLSDAKGGLDE